MVFDLLAQTVVVFQSLCIEMNNLRAFLQLHLEGSHEQGSLRSLRSLRSLKSLKSLK